MRHKMQRFKRSLEYSPLIISSDDEVFTFELTLPLLFVYSQNLSLGKLHLKSKEEIYENVTSTFDKELRKHLEIEIWKMKRIYSPYKEGYCENCQSLVYNKALKKLVCIGRRIDRFNQENGTPVKIIKYCDGFKDDSEG